MSKKETFELAESALAPEVSKKAEIIAEAVKKVEKSPENIVETVISVYDRAFKDGIQIGLRMEERRVGPNPVTMEKQKGFWNF